MCSMPAEPYGRKRDAAILALAEADELRVSSPVGHTLYVRIFTKTTIVAPRMILQFCFCSSVIKRNMAEKNILL